MSIHIFIATTQGLVAVNNLYSLPAVASSTVTAGGFADPLPITNSYHSFVKLGSGIIEADFSTGPFRIDLSDKITQGNSWQLGFYLAHMAKEIDALGDGKPNDGEMIIVATGCINTAERRVGPVDEVPRKLALADEALIHYKGKCDIVMLVPEANKHELVELEDITCNTADELDYLATYFPDPDVLRSRNNPTVTEDEMGTSVTVSSSAEQDGTGKVKKRSGKVMVAAALLLCAGAAAAYYVGFQPVSSEDSHTVNASIGSAARPVRHEPVSDTDKGAPATPTLSLTLKAATALKCDDNTAMPAEVNHTHHTFDTLSIAGELCVLQAMGSKDVSSIVFIGLGERRAAVRQVNDNVMSLPHPTQFSGERRYFLVALASPLSQKATNALKGFLFEMARPDTLTLSSLQDRLNGFDVPFAVYQHTLQSEGR
ncbi:hypothetical protein [Aestuariibacter sp. A3R04]|uniref:hypothetical protein n=1 Tax=Aestuariibacter sp. A3R04 TaxID=2841571 RepID=UPI001C093BAB|nr:hypothetical protein [Aestuariibacter sp. A3R04]MBU3020521.1 hypothetical protein [Aestuariibacter sp. A3R04]